MPQDKIYSAGKAQQRWHILANVLRKTGAKTSENSASVRRFSSFGLLNASKIEDNQFYNNKTEEGDISWHLYTCYKFPDLKAKIRQLSNSLEIADLLEFDNTGNVCIWPAEEILAFYCMTHKKKFKNKSVCELGGGMTCLAGIGVAIETEVKEMFLTDGNEKSIRNLEEIVNANKDAFGNSDVAARLLRWDHIDVKDENRFDIIICADCLFFDDSREYLASAMDKLLKPNGEVIVFAPSRGETMMKFMKIASNKFNIVKDESYDTHILKLHKEFEILQPDLYDPDLHYPVMLSLTKKPLT